MKLLVIVARGLNVIPLGAYGCRLIDTPTLDALAAGGITFDWHFSDHPDAVRAHWRSGGTASDFLALLQARGIPTHLVADTRRPLPEQFLAGWDRVRLVAPPQGDTLPEAILDAAESALDELRGVPDWLLWVDVSSLFPPWEVPGPFLEPYFEPPQAEEEDEEEEENEEEEEEEEENEEEEDFEPEESLQPLLDPPMGAIDAEDDELYLRVQTSFGAAVSYMDAAIENLLELLQDRVREPTVLFTSDHGQGLGERGRIEPGIPSLHEEIIHVPLILNLSQPGNEGRRVEVLTRAVDLPATIADLFGVAWPEGEGRSLLPLTGGAAEWPRTQVSCERNTPEGTERGLRTAEWFFHALPGKEPALYAKPDDRFEVNDVAHHHPDLVEELGRMMDGADRSAVGDE